MNELKWDSFNVFNIKMTIVFGLIGLASIGFWAHMLINSLYGETCTCYGISIEHESNRCRGIPVNCSKKW